ncbi:MAG: S8 family serine peptidase, partial [Gammaproteobacteria bacterium]|nr:S8 family serine peptidase [Gammaproteobacteria bacterium]
ETDVLSNSWGYASPTFLSPAAVNFDELIESGLTTGSGGKGISYVFAAGNDGGDRDSSARDSGGRFIPIGGSKDRSSYSEILNHRGAIVVCAVGSDDRVSSYSEFGPNLWLCGYSNTGRQPSNIEISAAHSHNALPLFGPGLPTLDLSGPAGYNDGGPTRFAPPDAGGACRLGGALFNFGAIWELLPACSTNAPAPPSSWPAGATSSYHRYFTGTSAATPMVSGVIALMRAAKADLTWRDVKLILAESARKPAGVSGFTDGANTYSNRNTSYSYNDAYGFGIVDAAAAVALAKKWTRVSQAMVKWMPSSVSVAPAITVPATTTTNINFIEYVQVEIQGGQGEPNFGALDIKLTRPSGKESVFAVKHKCANRIGSTNTFAETNDCPVFNNDKTFTFGAANFLGEDPAGTWTLVATRDGTPINLNWKLIIHGH